MTIHDVLEKVDWKLLEQQCRFLGQAQAICEWNGAEDLSDDLSGLREFLGNLITAHDSESPLHTKDADCRLDETECCTVCHVYHGAHCNYCGGRGFHTPNCLEE